jgi:hypothetical protein
MRLALLLRQRCRFHSPQELIRPRQVQHRRQRHSLVMNDGKLNCFLLTPQDSLWRGDVGTRCRGKGYGFSRSGRVVVMFIVVVASLHRQRAARGGNKKRITRHAMLSPACNARSHSQHVVTSAQPASDDRRLLMCPPCWLQSRTCRELRRSQPQRQGQPRTATTGPMPIPAQRRPGLWTLLD